MTPAIQINYISVVSSEICVKMIIRADSVYAIHSTLTLARKVGVECVIHWLNYGSATNLVY